MKTRSPSAVSLICLSFLAVPAAANVYYVSPQGQDGNDGLSPAKAWQTVAKVNAAKFAPGDQILFARGGEWRDSLKASSSGAPGKPILYAAYGAGAKPRFWGSDVLKNADFSPGQGTSYSCRVGRRVAAVLVDHRFLLMTDRATVANKPDSWCWEGDTLHINPAGKDPRRDKRTWTACVRVDCIHSNGKDHLIFRDLVSDESADVRDGYGFRVMGSKDVRLESCEAYRAGRHHFGAINSTEFVGKDLLCAHAMPNIPGGATFYVSFSDAGRSADTHQWLDCAAEHFENPGQKNYQVFYDHGEGLGPLLIQNMVSRGGQFSVGSSAKARVTIKGGLIEDASLEVFGSNILVDGLKIKGNGTVDNFGSDGLFQNLQLTIHPKNGGPTGYSSAIVCRNGAKRNTFRFCTVVLDPNAPDSASCLALVGKDAALKCHGNILLSKRVVLKQWAGNLDRSALAEADWNFYPPNPVFLSSDNKETPLAAWKGLGFDLHSLSGDPQFVNATGGDYSLKPSSPAIGAAKIDAAQRPETDLAGNPRTGGPCAMGANEPRTK